PGARLLLCVLLTPIYAYRMSPGPNETTENEWSQWWTCVCLKYGSGEPHKVSSST
ncbi:hypothetical protein PAXRUDRAFT_832884, partial [Paxillus rubicundulus Ve08.2h10]